MIAIIPGFDTETGNTNSVLFRAYPDCLTYTKGESLAERWKDKDIVKTATTVVVHSMGFFAFLVALDEGLFQQVNKLLVLDGYYSKNQMWGEKECPVYIPDIHSVYFFPTVGNRSTYLLETEHLNMHRENPKFKVVRGVGFGHNLLYESFDVEKARELIQRLIVLLEPEEWRVTYPFTMPMPSVMTKVREE
jgi:hypothetical protein